MAIRTMPRTIQIIVLGQFLLFDCFSYKTFAQSANDLNQTSSEMRAMIERFSTDRSTLLRSYDIDMSSLRTNKMTQLYRNWQRRLEEIDFAAMGQEGRIDYLLLKNYFSYELGLLDREEERFAEVSEYLPGWQEIDALSFESILNVLRI